MKALTICQPYADLIMSGEKRVENRTWPTKHRGLMYVHAGKSHKWLTADPPADMAFGEVIGIVRVIDCLEVHHNMEGEKRWSTITLQKYPWIASHEHAHGPFCWILEAPTRIGPWPMQGRQGLFNVSDATLDAIANKAIRAMERRT